ncbi:YdcF family protein [Brucella abortus]|uniref:YdcF family protein n=1 Tax=Brucella abortus TaxID=235 RepID=UPI0002CE896C|nr:YdcF family protein [Brucella abortus]ENS01115.1 hypothetical protein C030_01102 [Brucella abortus 85/69]
MFTFRKSGHVTLNLITALLVLGVFLWWGKWRKTGVLLIALAVISYGAIVSTWLPNFLMNRLQEPYSSKLAEPLEDNTVFVVFGLGTQTVNEQGHNTVEPLTFSDGSIFAAARFYHECQSSGVSCTFITTGADVAGTGVSEAASTAAKLEKAGVDSRAIIQDDRPHNAWTTARNVAATLRELKPARVVVLQPAPMMGRTLLYLAHFGIKPEPVATSYLTVNGSTHFSTSLSFLAMDLALNEEIGAWRYVTYNLMDWNAPKAFVQTVPAPRSTQ